MIDVDHSFSIKMTLTIKNTNVVKKIFSIFVRFNVEIDFDIYVKRSSIVLGLKYRINLLFSILRIEKD
jgi:hypothetical protein